VDLFGGAPDVKIPLVSSNEENVGHVAAQHLLERGFRFFAFCGRTGLNWSDARANGFRQCVTEAGFPFQMFSSEKKDDVAENIVSPKPGDDDVRGLKDWLDSLPKPVGIMTCNDVRGRAVIQACSELGLAVPDDVAVIGVDKDDVMSALAEVPLSSVIVNSQRIGYEAAALLDRMMNGERPPREAILIDPIGVATRRSTDIISVTDPNLAKAMLFIQKNCCETITIDSVAAFAGLSRSVLQRRFRSILRETVHEAIIRLRLKRARELLLGTNLPLLDVADSSGFKSGEYMGVVF
jgi:LacI family transcriptional regulator